MAQAQTTAADPAHQDHVRTAPQLPPWPTGLSDLREDAEGVHLPPDRAEATARMLRACLALPGRCQARLSALDQICSGRIDGAVDVVQTDCLAGRAVEQTDGAVTWHTWELMLFGTGTGVVGTGVGIVIAILALGLS